MYNKVLRMKRLADENIAEFSLNKLRILNNRWFLYFAFFFFGIIISLTWYEADSFIARGDTYPKINSVETFLKSFYLWSDEHFGYFNPASSVIYHWALWALLEIIFGASLGQTIFYGLMIGGSMLWIYLLTIKFFNNKLAGVLSSLFYVFNFFFVNYSYAQTVSYSAFFIPLLVLLTTNIVDKMKKQLNHIRETVIFLIVASTAIPILYVNPAALYTTIMTVASFWVFYFVTNKDIRKRIAINLFTICISSAILLSWFIFVNYTYLVYSNSSLEFVTETNWQWSHARLTLPNVLRLDGAWAWDDYRDPFYKALYENPFMLTTSYIPISLSFAAFGFAVLKRDEHFWQILFFSTSIALIILFLTNSTNQLGQFVYDVLPYSFTLREPYTKLLPPLVFFMSLLIAYSIKAILSKASFIGKIRSNSPGNNFYIRNRWKGLITIILGSLLLANGSQLIGKNHLESIILPGYGDDFSIYSKPPQYWSEAAKWINQQPGDWKVLFLPNNDYYQMPYDWGYYGVDFLSFYIDKPVVMQQYNYLLPKETTDSIGLIYKTISANDTVTFQHLLDIYNIRYILQRNDVLNDFGERKIIDPALIKSFLSSQNEITKVKQFGKLDIYEFSGLHTMLLSSGVDYDRTKESVTNFDTFNGWYQNLPQIQHLDIDSEQKRIMTATLDQRPSVWATVNSPILLASYYSKYTWEFNIEGENVHKLHIKVAEYDKSQKLLETRQVRSIGDGTISPRQVTVNHVPNNPNTAFIQLQIWHGYNTTKSLPNVIRISDVRLYEEKPSIISISENNDASQEPNKFKLNPTSYRFSLRSDVSGLLILDQVYDPLWQATIGTNIIPSQPVYGVFNGFPIDGDIYEEVTIEYKPQRAFNILLLLSTFMMIICLVIAIRPSFIDKISNTLKTRH